MSSKFFSNRLHFWRIFTQCVQYIAHFMCIRVICKHEGNPFRYPGTRYTWEHFCDVSDARVLAEQQIWAAVVTERAKNQAFNCTNGDVFTWKSLWKVLCEIFEVEFVPFDESEQFDLVEDMKKKEKVWDSIVENYGLYKTKLDEITSFAALDTRVNFKFQHVCSMNKGREFEFSGYADTLKSVGMLVEKLKTDENHPLKIKSNT